MLHTYTIMGLDDNHIDEICEDIREQYEQGIASCALFCMTLVPEGNPPEDKAAFLCAKYRKFREKLSAMGIPSGVLVQASIGHGWKLGAMFPYQKYVGLANGREENTVCPYDEGFKEYISSALRTIAACRPDHIMIDDDFRLIGRAGGGCACPMHMKRFNELAGTSMSRSELLAGLTGGDRADEYQAIYLETQREAVIETAKVMRAAIDSVAPGLPGSFCAVGNNAEFASEIAEILAGEGNPVILRINNGNYTPAGARFFSGVFFRAAAQIQKHRKAVDIFLAETDTCPQNRYSTGAMSLHTHYTGTILEGAAGAKHWITRLTCHEPGSGKAYRRTLKKYSGFYSALAESIRDVKWRGCRMPVLPQPLFRIGREHNFGEDVYSGWGECVMERLGIPMYFSGENGGILCLDGEVRLRDDEILEALKGPVLLASDSAECLIRRGFGEYIGVEVAEWQGKAATREMIFPENRLCEAQMEIRRLTPAASGVTVGSMLCNTVTECEPLAPGAVVFRNSLGGTVMTFAGSPRTNYNIIEAFSFLNETRKAQLVRLLKETGELPVYAPGDEEMYLRAGDLPDGSRICAVFNLGLDPIDRLELVISDRFSSIERLTPDGRREPVEYEEADGRVVLHTPCLTLDPAVLFIQ